MFSKIDLNYEYLAESLNIGILCVDKNDYIIYINKYCENILNLRKEYLNLIKIYEVCPILYENGQLKKFFSRIIGNEEKIFNISYNNNLDYKLILFEDATEIINNNKKIKMLTTIFDAIHEGVQISDDKGVTILYNHSCERFEGLKREEVIGKKITDVYDVTEESSIHFKVLKSGEPIKEIYYQYNTFEGNQVDVIASTYPYYDDGKIVAVYSINRDITKMKGFMEKNLELQRKVSLLKTVHNLKNGTSYTFEDIIGTSETFAQVISSAKKISCSNSSVLIYGETGTGKELFAQSIHNDSLNANGPFIALNCAAIPDTLLESLLFGTHKGAFTGAVENSGLFEQAENGTLFLDEINSMSLTLQAKLLRVLQEKNVRRIGGNTQRNVNCRIISSVNRDPLECIQRGSLREDIYYRLGAVTIFIPPLRERKDDISILTDYFIKKYNKQFGSEVKNISNQLREIFFNYSWPGNVRELEHVIEGGMNMINLDDATLDLNHLSIYIRKKFAGLTNGNIIYAEQSSEGSLANKLNEYEKKIIFETLQKNNWNVSKTAKELGIFRQALQYRMKKFNLEQ